MDQSTSTKIRQTKTEPERHPNVAGRDKPETPRFLIGISHSSEHEACARAVHALLSIGSHYVTHADWGCLDGVHKTWMIVEVDTRGEARQIVPPAFRSDANVIALNRFTLQGIKSILDLQESAA